MTNKLLFFVLLALCFSGCDMLETHPYDVHITGERELTNKNPVDRKQNARQKNNPLCHDQ